MIIPIYLNLITSINSNFIIVSHQTYHHQNLHYHFPPRLLYPLVSFVCLSSHPVHYYHPNHSSVIHLNRFLNCFPFVLFSLISIISNYQLALMILIIAHLCLHQPPMNHLLFLNHSSYLVISINYRLIPFFNLLISIMLNFIHHLTVIKI